MNNNKKKNILQLKNILISTNIMIFIFCFSYLYVNLEELEEGIISERVLSQNLRYAKNISDTTDSILKTASQILSYSANEVQKKELFAQSAEQSTLLEELVTSSDFFNAAVIVDENDYFVNNFPDKLGVVGKKFFNSDIKQLMVSKSIHISKPFVTPAGNYIISLSKSLTDENKTYRGYLSTAIYINHTNLLNNILSSKSNNSKLYVANNEGSIIFDNDIYSIGMNISNRNLPVSHLNKTSGSLSYTDSHGHHMYLSYYRNSIDWIIIVETPSLVTIERLENLMGIIGEKIIISILIGLIAIYVLGIMLSRPLEKIVEILDDRRSIKSFSNIFTWYSESEKIKNSLEENIKLYNDKLVKLDDANKLDPLTKLYNRRYFDKYVMKVESECIRSSIIFMDIDNFKLVNDVYGHHIGDISLLTVAKILSSVVDDSGKVFRFGGEEFVVVLPSISLEFAKYVSNRIRKEIEECLIEDVGFITVSLGLSEFISSEVHSFETVLKEADLALNRAKKLGKNRTFIFNDNV